MSKRREELLADAADAGLRLDLWLAGRLVGVSRKAIKRAFDGGRVFVDGRVERRANRPLRGDETIRVTLEGEAPPLPPPELTIIHRDAELLAIDKPAGLPAHPTVAGRVNALDLARELLAGEGGPGRPILLHRLDADTTGVLLFALSAAANRELARQFAERQIVKTYLALVAGTPPERFEVGNFLKTGVRGRTVAVPSGGQPAETFFRRLALGEGYALVEAVPKTGRTHQIRAHLAGEGYPLLGDALYGGPVSLLHHGHPVPLRRHLLHALSLACTHPTTRQSLTIHASVPKDFMMFWPDLEFPPTT